MIDPPRCPPRLSLDDALLIWRAREVHRVQSCFVGLVPLVVVVELLTYVLVGRWVLGLVLVGLQWVLWRGLRSGLRWVWRQVRRPLPL
jgi:hypothetical protein